ncbi:hypothetical protein F511_24257 [Dorcoceras hygrometricum]|uniref:Uncharacterized protein n=1 Tax=Dorcoceras hygrometricum TaxID=472368 RepID=A0A2Z7CC74_9LAMI|nr:hypothetical protein F511_24257 [Dorcoceras hygrometricum]
MASSLVSNTSQVHFASVLAMDNAEMVAMIEALVASGLNDFMGCMSDISETTLIEFYQNASIRDGKVVSTVQGKLVEISEEVFAPTFQLPVEGLIDINEVPKDLIFDARTEFSFTGEQLTTSCKKRELKIEYRLLIFQSLNKDIAAKEENVLTWEETDSVQVALQRKVYILAKNHKIIISTCWLRLLRRIGDVWVVEDGYDRWVHEDETPVSQLLLGELVAYINRGNDKKGEESSRRRPQPPPDDQNRPSGGNANRGGGGGGSGGSGRRDDRKGSSTKRGSGSSSAGGSYKKNAEWWLYGKNQF